jgi:pimeloyl-ACP methyl ester carboxylesterase
MATSISLAFWRSSTNWPCVRAAVPLLAVFGADDPLVPIDDSVEALRDLVDDDLLHVRVFERAGHRRECGGDGFVDGYLETVASFATVCSTRPPAR